MSRPLVFDRSFDPAYGTAVEIVPGLRRLTARNPGGYTFHGTNTYLVGTNALTVIDPGPEDEAHVADILKAAGGAPITHVLVTHTHRDHSPATRLLKDRTGALVLGAGPHRPARAMLDGEAGALDASADFLFAADRELADGDVAETPAGRFRAIATPGHTVNHLAFALEDSGHLFSGDHVMGWSTSIVAPPDGAMADYMASLDRIAAAPETRYLPGHGGAVEDGPGFVAGLRAHRLAREAAVLAAVAAGAGTVRAIVETVYRDTDPKLWGAAGLSVFAQLEWLVEKGMVTTDGPARLHGAYRAG
ncbi:MBL fold metallo-hydrolase [Chthonobacter rhizosphaerae]|uniref:MBL fold metallo-hydrolase n=1 Tax=Chthonobacter rhizosphaerae TaxID=2735553 RepID=UPI0015EF1678|nr:MBL fold metallo-hydrolase [Chthonobacter rhizosphaerae]